MVSGTQMCSTCGVFLLTSQKQNILSWKPIYTTLTPSKKKEKKNLHIGRPFLLLLHTHTHAHTRHKQRTLCSIYLSLAPPLWHLEQKIDISLRHMRLFVAFWHLYYHTHISHHLCVKNNWNEIMLCLRLCLNKSIKSADMRRRAAVNPQRWHKRSSAHPLWPYCVDEWKHSHVRGNWWRWMCDLACLCFPKLSSFVSGEMGVSARSSRSASQQVPHCQWWQTHNSWPPSPSRQPFGAPGCLMMLFFLSFFLSVSSF